MLVGLSHDADSIRRSFKHVWKVRHRFTLKQIVSHALGIRNLYNNFVELMELEEKHGVRSTFFIPVVFFSLDELEDVLKELVKGGWEIGLHYVAEPIQRRALLRLEKTMLEEKIEHTVNGVRTHNLAVNKELLRLYAEEGFIYDSSYRMEEVGQSTPFMISSEVSLTEVPIGVMDTDLFGRLHLSENKALRYVLHKLRTCKEAGEKAFTLLFHQESYSMKGGRIYSKILEEVVSSTEAYKISELLDKLRERSVEEA